MAGKSKIIVSGIAFWYPLGGVFWQFLHYLLGLRQLGHDVYYVEDSARDVYDPNTNDFTPNPDANISAIAPMLEKYGFKDKWCFRSHYPNQQRCFGLSESQLTQLYHDADVFLNVTGAQEIRDEHMKIPRRIYVETDPCATQIAAAEDAAIDEKTIEQLKAHDSHFSFGENIGQPDCLLPSGPFKWLPTRQPICHDLWQHDSASGDNYTTIATWQNKGRDIYYKGEIYYWSKDREFQKFRKLPSLTAAKIELASAPDYLIADRFRKFGWRFTDPLPISRDLHRYRQYIQSSRGEFTVAKDQNIRLKSGWFSDRSACYLASARPVITQETGFSNHLPTGQGLFAFRTMQDILSALDKIESDYPKASRAALDIAHSHFSAQIVLQSLLSRAGL
jgi:hypothetical protein